jgi:U3 small nucleolar RNA-associated protein 12
MKTYLKYTACATMGLISSPTSNAIATSTLAITPSLESITLWDLKKGTLTATLADSTNKAAVTALELLGDKLAAGYADGKIRVWSITSMQVLVTFNGHKSAVTSLVFGDQILVSGSRDTDIIVWDLIDEAGLYRLRGHKDAITGLVLLTENNLFHLVSTAKDSLLKVLFCYSSLILGLVFIDTALY